MSSDSGSDNDDQNPNSILSSNSGSIDTSLDATENQLESISITSQTEARSFNQREEQLMFTNGLLTEESGSKVADEFKKELSDSKLMEESSSGVIMNSSSVWRYSSLEAEEVESPSSPSSSGYAGERGSSNGATSLGDEEIHQDSIREARNAGILSSQEQWVPRERDLNEVSLINISLFLHILNAISVLEIA